MPEGKLFYIKSQLNGLVLDICGGSSVAGKQVITWPQRAAEKDSQLWYEDHITGTIRNKLNTLCLDTNAADELVVDPYVQNKENQQWLAAGDRLLDRQNHNRVVSVLDENEAEGAKVICSSFSGGKHQKWSFHYAPARLFTIRSQLHGKVLDIKVTAEGVPGSKVIMMDKVVGVVKDEQLWYEDKHGVINSKYNGHVLDSSEDGKIRLHPFIVGTPYQMWTLQDNRIINRIEPSKVLTIKHSQRKDGAKLQSAHWKDQDHQKWILDFIKQ